MEDYKTLVRKMIEDEVGERLEGAHDTNDDLTRREVLEALRNNHEDVFGNISGSRTMSAYQAQQFIDKSGALWDDDIRDLFNEVSDTYFMETLTRGAETLDVVICELLAGRIIDEMLEEAK